MVEDEKEVDVMIEGDVDDTKDVDKDVENEDILVEVDDDDIIVVVDDEKVVDVLVVDKVFVGGIVEGVGTF